MLNKRTFTIAVLSSVLGIATAHAQSSAGRGAPDPLIPKDIVGSEGKGYYTGAGIPAAELPRLFERFYRVDKARSRELGGTGLGLSIVKHLVQAMRGQVRVHSTLGKGTTFRVTLPRAGSA